MESDEKRIKFYKRKIGLFGNFEYSLSNGKVIKALGGVAEVDDEGFILVQHLKSAEKSWRFHYSKIVSEFFEKLGDDKHE